MSLFRRLFHRFNYYNTRYPRGTKIALLSTGTGIYYFYHLDQAPVTGRRRFIAITKSQEHHMAATAYHSILEANSSKLVPNWHPANRIAKSVVTRLLQVATQYPELAQAARQIDPSKSVHVIDEPDVVNAMVLPGGQIFIYTGILKIINGKEGQLAAVLGHELAHYFARHAAENMSLFMLLDLVIRGIKYVTTGDPHLDPLSAILKKLVFELPFSRRAEREADYIGLLLMAKACYNPIEAIQLWTSMEKIHSQSKALNLLSTHPSHNDRISSFERWMPKAQQVYQEAGCEDRYRGFMDTMLSRFG